MVHGKPRRILLATDLSHRSDRALDRSVQLARAWGATLVVVHALEEVVEEYRGIYEFPDTPSWRRGLDPVTAVRNRLCRDLQDEGLDLDLDIEVVVKPGAPADIVMEAAEAHGADLIVTGVSRSSLLDRVWFGSTVERLSRKSPIPLLVVRDRTFAPYRRVVVATDFSPSSRDALETAAAWFGNASLSLLHGYNVPFASYLGQEDAQHLYETGMDAADRFLAETDLHGIAPGSIERLIEHGAPDALLRDLASHSSRHLVVVGSHGGGLIYEALVGSTARKIMEAVPGDVLLVPAGAEEQLKDAAD